MNWVFIGSGHGLLPVRHQTITWTSAGLLSIGLLETNFSDLNENPIIFIQENAFENIWQIGSHFVQWEMI